MKKVLLIILLFGFLMTYGQKQEITYTIDTIKIDKNGVLTKISLFVDGLLIEEKNGYLIPDTIKIPKFKFTGNLFTTKIPVDRIIRHGVSTYFYKNNFKKVDIYENGKLIETNYYDASGQTLSQEEISKLPIKIRPYGNETKEYIISGQKTKD